MHTRPTSAHAARALVAAALILSFLSLGGNCANVGTVYDPNPPGGGGGNPPGPTPPGPPAPLVEGALTASSAPFLSAMAPKDGAVAVDVKAPVVLWFSESLNFSTLTTASLTLQDGISGINVAHAKVSFYSDRCIALIPNSDLQINRVYDVVATDDVTDLTGNRLILPTVGGVLGSFSTSSLTTGVPPRVLNTFPPDFSTNVPNDYPVLLIFSKPIDFASLAPPGVTIESNGSPAVAFGAPVGYENDRIIEYPHENVQADLNANMSLDVADSITDTEFVPLPLQSEYRSSWNTLEFGPPVFVLAGAPAVNLGNLSDFMVTVEVPPSVTTPVGTGSFTVQVFLNQGTGAGFVTSSQTGDPPPKQVDFVLNLSNLSGQPLLEDGSLILGSYIERGGRRSTCRVMTGLYQDTVRPTLTRFGPPTGSVPSRFATSVRELRVVGEASETIKQVCVDFPSGGSNKCRIVEFGDPNGFFVGPSSGPADPMTTSPDQPQPFTVLLTDDAGNEMESSVAGSAVFRGYVGGAALTGSGLRVEAFNRRTLAPISGAVVYVQDDMGGNLATGVTSANGSLVFPNRTGPQTVTIDHPSFHAVSIFCTDASLLSLPMRESFIVTRTVAPFISGVTGGTVRLGSAILRDSSQQLRPDSLLDEEVPPGPVNVEPDRPAWFCGFHDVESFIDDGMPTQYFDRFALDICRILPPSDPAVPQIQPVMPMIPSTNTQNGTSDYIYFIQGMIPGTGFESPVTSSSVAATLVLPGLVGIAPVGAGALASPPTRAEVEVELILYEEATAEEDGDGSTLSLQIYATDADGDQVLVRRPVALEAMPPPINDIDLPDVPVVGVQDSPQDYPPTLDIAPTLAAGDGYYRLVLEDGATVPAQWDLWVPSGALLPDGELQLPDLGGGENSPLELGSWVLFCEAFGMPSGFATEDFFFTELRRDNLSWARSIPSPPFTVNLATP